MPKTRTAPTLTELDALREHAIETLNQAEQTAMLMVTHAADLQQRIEQAARQYLERLDVGDVAPAPPEQPVPPAVAARVTDAPEPQDPPLP